MKEKSTVLVTGASAGIGAATASLLEERGFSVIRVSRSQGDIQLDLYKNESEHTLLTQLQSLHISSLKAWVHCPAESYQSALLNIDLDQSDKVMQHNFTRIIALSKVLFPLLSSSPEGRVVQLSSIVAHKSAGDRSIYAASKAALETWVRYTAKEWIQKGVRLNAVAPWYVRTPRTAERLKNPALQQEIEQITPIGRPAEAKEIAGVIAFLLSDDSSYIVGQTLLADGGLTL